jgi:CheY-like chemotaxis protein
MKPMAADCRVQLLPVAGDCRREVISSGQQFRQVLLNLLSNAVKYNRSGGTVTVTCKTIKDRLRISIADTGRGIAAEHFSKLFLPFERLEHRESVIEGAGLGLSLSKSLTEAMGGRIGVESVLGEGATFWVELPSVSKKSTETRSRHTVKSSGQNDPVQPVVPRTLLYIEDNLSNLRLVERILARRPEVKLISAMQGSIGLELIRQHQPDLVLLDLHLPDIQGDEILRQLRADPRTQQLRVVMISADAIPAQIDRLRAASADDYLTKPIDVRKFLALVDATPPSGVDRSSTHSVVTHS